ncbi:MAG TPA: twin-arginine translocase TatA/TatE family subunit [Sphingomicrobium sp.]|jgi:sec-independent protein translocase protein TatA|nr:twin-arginine translocase TatA/TatE family subunit [Sphingomicrobium sp.]
MGSFGLIHWIILGLFILLLFGGNRFSSMMNDVAKGLKSFKQGMSDDEDEKTRQREERRQLPPQSRAPEQPIDVTPERRPQRDDPREDEQPRG